MIFLRANVFGVARNGKQDVPLMADTSKIRPIGQ